MPDNSASEGSSTLGAQHQKDNQLMPVRVEAWPITRMNSLITPGFGRKFFDGEFDPGSGRTLAACLMHASRTRPSLWVTKGKRLVANG